MSESVLGPIELSELVQGRTIVVPQGGGGRAVFRVASMTRKIDGTWTLDLEPVDGPADPLYTYRPVGIPTSEPESTTPEHP